MPTGYQEKIEIIFLRENNYWKGVDYHIFLKYWIVLMIKHIIHIDNSGNPICTTSVNVLRRIIKYYKIVL